MPFRLPSEGFPDRAKIQFTTSAAMPCSGVGSLPPSAVTRIAVSAKTWAVLSAEDRDILRKVGEEIMTEQKKEARGGVTDNVLANSLEKIYQMEVTRPQPIDIEPFRQKTKIVYDKWAQQIGAEIVRSAEKLAENPKPN